MQLALLVLAVPGLARDGEETNVPLKNFSAQEMREESLDRLFASLRKASGEQAAKATEEKIWELWSRSDSATAEVLLGQAVMAMGAADNAASLEILDRIIVAYPTFAEAWNKRATLHFMIGNYDASLADIEKVLDLEPRHFGALAGRGMIYQRQGKWSAGPVCFQGGPEHESQHGGGQKRCSGTSPSASRIFNSALSSFQS